MSPVLGHSGVASLVTFVSGGRKTVTTAGTRVALVSSATFCSHVVVQALEGNTGRIAVGGVDVVEASGTRVGIILNGGDVIDIPVQNVATVYIDSSADGEGVSFLYYS